MTITDVLEAYDDYHLLHLYAQQVLQREDEERLTARICSSVNTSVMNAMRLSGHGSGVKDEHYRDEESYLPASAKQLKKPRVQQWDEIRNQLFQMQPPARR